MRVLIVKYVVGSIGMPGLSTISKVKEYYNVV